MATVTVTLGAPQRPMWVEGQIIWLKFHKNKSRRKLGYVRSIKTHTDETVLAVTAATHKEKDHYKNRQLIKRLK
jgi:hypothetical protein